MRISDLILIILGAMAYLNIGYLLGAWSQKIFHNWLRRYDLTPPRKIPPEWLIRFLWPIDPYNAPVRFDPPKEYIITMTFFWGIKLVWILGVNSIKLALLIIGLIVGGVIALCRIITLPSEKILKINDASI